MTTQQLIRTTDAQQTAIPDRPRVVPTSRRRTVIAVGAGAVAVAVVAAGAALVVGRPVEPGPTAAVTGASAPTVGEAVHGGPGSQRDAQAAAYAALGLPGAEGPTAHGGAGTVRLTDGIRLHRSGYVVPRTSTTGPTTSSATATPAPDRSRLDRLVPITSP